MDASVSAGTESRPAASPLRIVLAFAAVYVIWGTTFLAIRYAVETIPPFLMMAARCLLAGAALVALSRPSRGAALTPAHWRSAVIAGALFFLSAVMVCSPTCNSVFPRALPPFSPRRSRFGFPSWSGARACRSVQACASPSGSLRDLPGWRC